MSQVLPQVQNILKEVQNREVSGPKDHERPDPGSECLGRGKRDQIPKSSSNMAINCGENVPQSHYISAPVGPINVHGDAKSLLYK